MFNYYEIRQSELSVERHKKILNYRAHMHNDFELFYVTNGVQLLNVKEKTYTLKAGDCAVIFPNVIHSYKRPEAVNGEELPGGYTLIFTQADMVYSMFPETKNTYAVDCVVNAEDIGENAVLAFEKIVDEASINAQIGWAHIIFSYLIPPIMAQGAAKDRRVNISSRLISYVSLNYKEPLSLDSVADALGISRFTVSRIFSNEIKTSFRSYIGMLRSNCAAEIIKQQDLPFEAVAKESGFESLRSFYRVFTSVYNISPAKYRSLIRGY